MNYKDPINAAWEQVKRSASDPDDRANLIIAKSVMIIGFSGALPVVSWAALAAGNVAAISILGSNYNFAHGWNAKRSRELLNQMLRGASYSSIFLLGGGKIIAELLKVTGVGTFFGMAADGLLNAAVTYTLLSTAKEYFQRGGVDDAELKRILRENLKKSRDAAREIRAQNAEREAKKDDPVT